MHCTACTNITNSLSSYRTIVQTISHLQCWLFELNRSLSSTRKDLNYLHHLNAEKWYKKQVCVLPQSDSSLIIVAQVSKWYWVYYGAWAQWRPYRTLLWPSDAIWQYISRSTLTQVMACCLTAPSQYLNQWWLISAVLWHSFQSNFTPIVLASFLCSEFENRTFRITVETLYSTIYYSKYFIELNFDKSTQYVALWTHKRHPIPRPFGRAMECLLWVLQQKLTVL